MPEPSPLVKVSHFSKRYRKKPAVSDLSFTIQRGELYGLIGPDGAGKSTLMKAVAGVLSYEGGSIQVFGVPVDSERAAERIKDRIGFMPQGLGLNLYPELSVEENVDFFARLRLVPEQALEARKRELLAMTRLDPFKDRAMKHLSGGMKQKLGLVCTLIHLPELVILDEPTTGVDPVSRRDFWAILARFLKERRITALISTAYLDEAARFHRLALLFEGTLIAEGEPDALLKSIPGTLVLLKAKPQMEALERLKARFPEVEALGPWLRVFLEGKNREEAQGAVLEALSPLVPQALHATSPELEDVFVALLRHKRLARDVPPPLPPMRSKGAEGLAIEALGLVKDFGTFRAVDHVSFRIRHGEIFGLLGANGAGKTTVIKMLTGILPPTEGEGRVAGVDMRRAGMAVKARIGYMSQAFSLYLDLTVLENLRLFAGIYGVASRRRIQEVLAMLQLAGQEGNLSGRLPLGLRQRLALGCAILHRPRVLFLDEPTSGVDPIGRRRFWDILLYLARTEGVAILVTTHYMSEAEHCDRLALMHAGRIIAEGSPEALKEGVEKQAGKLLSLAIDRPMEALALIEEAGFPHAALFGKRIHLLAPRPDIDLPRLRALLERHGFTLKEAELRPMSLEDVFIYHMLRRELAP